MKRIEYTYNQVLGNNGIAYMKEIQPHISSSGRKRRKALFLCHCGKKYKSIINDVKHNNSKSCGCSKGREPAQYLSGSLINDIEFIKSLGIVKNVHYAMFRCPKCKSTWKSSIGNIQQGHSKTCCSKTGGWSRSQWVSRYTTSLLYKILLYNDDEEFIKIGICSTSIKKRMARIPYSYKILKSIKGESGYIFDLENRVNRIYKQLKYTPKLDFGGRTECFINTKKL